MSAPIEVRVRRPQQHEVLIHELQEELKFSTYRDVLLFAAAVGYKHQRRISFTTTSGEPIRSEVLMAPTFSDTLINMIAANEQMGDPEIMDDSRLGERLTIFEEYANGGLEYVQEQINVMHKSVEMIVIDLVVEAFDDSDSVKPVSVDDLLSGASWT